MSFAPRQLATALLVLPLAAVGAALYTQYAWDMQPCPWCVLQRVVFLTTALAALPAVLFSASWARWISGGLSTLLATAGASAALWQHFVAASSSSCALTWAGRFMSTSGLDERLPQVFAAYASCAEAKVNLMGVPYEFYSLMLFLGLAGLGTMLLTGQRRG